MRAVGRRDLLASLLAAPALVAGADAGAAPEGKLSALLARRRMVRRFRPEPVGDDVVRRLVDTATRAPSAGNMQPWAFVVVRDAEMRRAIGRAAAGQEWLAEAPVAIVPCADPSRARPRYGTRAEHYALIDTAFASLLLLLAVTELGLGACFVGALDEGRVRRLLGLPREVLPLAVIPVGHPAESPVRVPRRRLRDVLHRERWGG